MKIRIYHELNGTVRIVKVVEQGPEKGKESSMFHDLKPDSMAEVEIDAVLQHQACVNYPRPKGHGLVTAQSY